MPVVEALETRRFFDALPADVPEIVHISATDDASVRGGSYATTNYGSVTNLDLKTSSNASYDRDAFIRFDLTSLSGKDLSSVVLRLNAGNQSNHADTVQLAIKTAVGSWSESTLNYNNRPATPGAVLGTMSVSGAKKWFEIDLTSTVQNALTDGQTSISFGIEATAVATPVAQISSSESGLLSPELVATVEGEIVDPPPPTPIDLPVTRISTIDSYVQGGSTANTNYGNSGLLRIKYSTNAAYNRIGYIRFDISGLSGTTIPSAKFRFYGGTSQNNSTLVPVTAALVSGSWTENGVTYNNRPALAGGSLGTVQLSSTANWFEIDITAAVQSAVTAGKTSIDVALSGVVNLESYGLINSAEAASNRPEIVIGGAPVVPTPMPISWQAVAANPVKREEAVTFDYGGNMYVIGGYVNPSTYAATQRVDRYNAATNTWTRLNDSPTKITHAGTAVDTTTGIAWMVGGFIGDFPSPPGTEVVWKYDIANDTWQRGPDLPEARGAGGAGIIGRTLYYFMGNAADRVTGSHKMWSLDLDNPDATWQARADSPESINHFGYAAVNGKLWSIGGQYGIENDATNQTTVLIYDPVTDSWTYGTPVPVADSHYLNSTDGYRDRYIIFAGGEYLRNNGTDNVWLLDTQTQTWQQLTDLPAGRRAPAGMVIGDEYIVGAGFDRSVGFSNLFWKADLTVLALP